MCVFVTVREKNKCFVTTRDILTSVCVCVCVLGRGVLIEKLHERIKKQMISLMVRAGPLIKGQTDKEEADTQPGDRYSVTEPSC